ncbi:MAG: glycine zipper 2TM domain-containing protein [Proteobacteria bacterium]|nr:glycine zipper 2TM domain-containing protein [Pseudomonadota bacterium]
MNLPFARRIWVLALVAVVMLLAGCEPYPTRPAPYYGGGSYYGGNNYPPPQSSCYNSCGVVQDIQQVYLQGYNNGNAALGTVIGAVVGGVLGNTIGKGDGRKAATVGGAVAGGFAGHAIGSHSDGQGTAWQIVVRLDDGRYATVTQGDPPNVRIGDYVNIVNNRVYPRGR